MTPARADLSNRSLAAIVTLSLTGGVFLAILTAALPGAWGASGGPVLQAAAAIGSAMLLASFAAVVAKRFGRPGKAGFRSHVWLASLGGALVFAHAAQNLTRPPALLLLALIALIALGVWSRTRGARMTAQTFGEKRGGFRKPDAATREELRGVIAAKQAVLAKIDPAAVEAQFSLQPRHYLRRPAAALAYARLAAREETLTGARAVLPPAQARWRLAHRLIAWGFVGGLLMHILIVMVFAGYAADGQAPYWLHFFAWDF